MYEIASFRMLYFIHISYVVASGIRRLNEIFLTMAILTGQRNDYESRCIRYVDTWDDNHLLHHYAEYNLAQITDSRGAG